MTITDLGKRPATAYNMVVGEANLSEALGGSSSLDTGGRYTSERNSDYESNIAEFAKQDCKICRGTGKCNICDGDGYLSSAASGKEDRNCWNCSNGRCRYCGGTGKQN